MPIIEGKSAMHFTRLRVHIGGVFASPLSSANAGVATNEPTSTKQQNALKKIFFINPFDLLKSSPDKQERSTDAPHLSGKNISCR
jgi:hypothetical protein